MNPPTSTKSTNPAPDHEAPRRAPVRVMAHWVAGYPDAPSSRDALLALAAGGADYLEVQFPFSDPSADGPAIADACRRALDNGFRTADGFALVREVRAAAPRTPVFVMTYAGVAAAGGGPAAFVQAARAPGVAGLIIPDLPPDYDDGLYAAGREASVAVTPVVAPGTTDARLAALGRLAPEYVYTSLRAGITGAATEVEAETLAYLARARATGGRILAGFGVRSHAQAARLAPHVHAVVAGTFFLEAHRRRNGDPAALSEACRELKCGGPA